MGRIKAKTFVMPMSSDMFFPPSDCQAEWRLIPDAEFRPIQTIDGHLALFGADANAIAQLDKHLRFFADRAAKKWPLRGSLKLGVGCL